LPCDLETLLRTTVPVPAGCVAPEGSPMSPRFRVDVQHAFEDGVHFIIHADGHSSDTLDLVAKGNSLTPLAAWNTRPQPAMDEVCERRVRREIGRVLKNYAGAFYLDCGDGAAGMLERAAEALAEQVTRAALTAIGPLSMVRPKSASELVAVIREWLDADDATHWGSFEKSLDAACLKARAKEEG